MSTKRLPKSPMLGLACLLLASTAAFAQQDPTRNLTPVTDAMLRDPPASDWLMWRRTYNGWGYSPLDQINKDNVKNLRAGMDLVDDSRRHRDDADRSRRRPLHLQLRPTRSRRSTPRPATSSGNTSATCRRSCSPRSSNVLAKRNMAIYGDKLIVATSDAHLVALDAKTGKVVWDHTTADWTQGLALYRAARSS